MKNLILSESVIRKNLISLIRDNQINVKQSVLDTFKELCRIYIDQINTPNQLINAESLPGVKVKSHELAINCCCRKRTIQNHLRKLLEYQLVVHRINSYHGIELFIEPKIVFKNQPYKGLKYRETQSFNAIY